MLCVSCQKEYHPNELAALEGSNAYLCYYCLHSAGVTKELVVNKKVRIAFRGGKFILRDLQYGHAAQNSQSTNRQSGAAARSQQQSQATQQNATYQQQSAVNWAELSKKHPSEFLAMMDEVVGQDKAKMAVASLVYSHIQRASGNQNEHKRNVLISGPTGSGKTEMIRAISKKLNIPMVIIDASQLTPSGYKGYNLSEALSPLLSYGQDALKGIVVLDEFDKIFVKTNSEDNFKRSVQNEVLKLFEDGSVPVVFGHSTYELNTSGLSIICLGAFYDLRNNLPQEMANQEDWHKYITKDFLAASGIKQEVLGRITHFASTSLLSTEEIMKILLKPGGVIETNKRRFGKFGATINFSKKYLEEKALLARKLGVRGVIAEINQTCDELIFSAKPGKKYEL